MPLSGPYSRSRASGLVNLPPYDIAGLALFLWSRRSCFTDNTEATLCTQGANVGRFGDLSGNARPADQVTATKFPLYQTSGINSGPSVRFDGTNDFLITAAWTIAHPCTIVLVGFSNAINGYWVDGRTGNTRVVVNTSTTDISCYSGVGFVPVTIADLATPRFYAATFNAASSVMRQNGTAGTPADAGDLAELAGFIVGDYGLTQPTQPLNGDISAICIYNRVLAAAEIGYLQSFFKRDFALA